MSEKENAEKIVQCIYEAYGTGTGYLFGIHPESRSAIVTIVDSTLKILKFWRERQLKGKRIICDDKCGLNKDLDVFCQDCLIHAGEEIQRLESENKRLQEEIKTYKEQ